MLFSDVRPGHQGHKGKSLASGGSVLLRGRKLSENQNQAPEGGPKQGSPWSWGAPGPSPSDDVELGAAGGRQLPAFAAPQCQESRSWFQQRLGVWVLFLQR